MNKNIEQLFLDSKGQPILYGGKTLKMVDLFHLPTETASLKITFVSSDSQWRQGLVLSVKGSFNINGKKISNKIVIWEDSAPKEIKLLINSSDRKLTIYNVWETPDKVTQFWHNGSAMYVEELINGNKYYCNDGYPDDDLNDLIFTVEIEENNSK